MILESTIRIAQAVVTQLWTTVIMMQEQEIMKQLQNQEIYHLDW